MYVSRIGFQTEVKMINAVIRKQMKFLTRILWKSYVESPQNTSKNKGCINAALV